MNRAAEELLARAVAAAEAAADVLLNDRPAALQVAAKSTAVDAVTEMDRRSEDLLITTLLAAGPHDAVLGEEGGSRAGTSGVRWIVDPLDGTVNYIYDLPEWSVSIAAELDGVVVAGAVLAPRLGRIWTASRGGGRGVRTGRQVAPEPWWPSGPKPDSAMHSWAPDSAMTPTAAGSRRKLSSPCSRRCVTFVGQAAQP